MRILKTLLKIVLLLIVAVLITALFVKKEMAAERSIVINKPKTMVYDYVKYLKNQNNYSKWAAMDPAMKKTYSGTDGSIGFVSGWDSEDSNVGAGEQEIKKMEGDKIDYELRFIRPFKATNYASMQTSAITDSTTKVTWSFSGKSNYPLNIMNLFFDADKMIGDDYTIGLQNLKTILEK
jgi:hypothetical protein